MSPRMYMMAILSSPATLAVFTFLLCNLHNCYSGSWAMAAERLETVSGIGSGSDGRHAASAVPRSAILAEAEQQHTLVPVHLRRSKRTSLTKRSTALSRRTKTMIAAKVVLSLVAILGLLVASVKLQQCRRSLPESPSREAEGITGRRLAEGGGDDEKCVSVVPSSAL
ncbi:Toxoplasma gondii family B protein [Toxoplasma gondii TgCatPRC2]|uniref:Toxoplasma gondii family B protein n=12 Tax=Toxoplasma gondii TaxID=5811 RepID=A0A125YMG5_TOXGV|nr:Toxoplasma gondii family B protein [Toxoplasma gondii GT1]ESS36451.1 Toxoplasma gondii family B protein [Toxoplasma gondii VEG]KAF4642519.1 Toxoplasma gondii family B protein [Toxoplasma gondii]KFG27947.1 Toxoplasma gondii family B protein [Toxoplasma gondii p89]KFG29595.1 Toxoplasma gondii family B protein [Toxoplasma gondii GAB2-2007-GAL-DOM2]KFG32689.1 Toxoplasma gondii family B protein [Toxoplasma gondii FOU]KFH01554.1 Toxoplasma gondii family B protein [Toxoplasma gondii MAS]KYF38619